MFIDLSILTLEKLVNTAVVLVTSARSPRVVVTNRVKMIDQKDANPCKDGNAKARSLESDHGFESFRAFSFFLYPFINGVSLTEEHP